MRKNARIGNQVKILNDPVAVKNSLLHYVTKREDGVKCMSESEDLPVIHSIKLCELCPHRIWGMWFVWDNAIIIAIIALP